LGSNGMSSDIFNLLQSISFITSDPYFTIDKADYSFIEALNTIDVSLMFAYQNLTQ
jgi:hypothetical protein